MPPDLTPPAMVYCAKCGWFGDFTASNSLECPMCQNDHLYPIMEGRLLVACMVCKAVITYKDGKGETGVSHGGHRTCIEKYGIALRASPR